MYMLKLKSFCLYLVFLFLSLLSLPTIAQDTLVIDRAELNTPYHTIYTHLYFLMPENYDAEIAARVFRPEDVADKDAERLAIMLKQFYDGKGYYIDMDIIPRESDYIDTATNRNRYYLFKNYDEIYVEKVGDNWYYSSRTVNEIPNLHRQVYPFGSDLLMNLIPRYGQKEFFGLQVWQHLGILLIIIIAFILHKILTLLIEFVINRLTKRYKEGKDHVKIVHRIAIPVSYLILTLVVAALVPLVQLPITTGRYIILTLNALTPLFGAIALYRGVDLVSLYFERQASKTANTLDDMLVPLLRKSLKVFVVITGVLFILQNLNFNITALLAGLSIGGLAFALAAQDMIKNFFGSLMIFADKPFQIGDWINFQGVDGMVEEVGFRSTRVRTFANTLVSVPNGRIVDMVVDNFGKRNYRRFFTTIAITYDTPPAVIQTFVDGLRKIIEKHPNTRKDFYEIHLNNLGSHSLDIMFYVFFKVPTWSLELKARHEIIMETISLAKTLGVRFAFPTETIHIEDFPEKTSSTPEYNLEEQHLKSQLAAYVQKSKLMNK
ncbi:MAG: mechanosensitive ion channel family protein [Chitinophagaceae bacterium]|nr:MAG: mechanosensitive ion channel family protein [Chitinophagaceae bacterium]